MQYVLYSICVVLVVLAIYSSRMRNDLRSNPFFVGLTVPKRWTTRPWVDCLLAIANTYFIACV